MEMSRGCDQQGKAGCNLIYAYIPISNDNNKTDNSSG